MILDLFSLKGKTAIVTGGEGLLGRIIVQTVMELGGNPISVDLAPTATRVLDITDGKAVSEAAESTPPVDILVNCAIGNQKPVRDAAEGFGADLNIGLVGALNMTAAFGSKMQKGVILNIGSDLSFVAPDWNLYPPGLAKPVSYSVVKHGIIGMTRYFAALWGHRGIRVNCLCPGSINQGQAIPRSPLNRLAEASEMKGPVAFLISDASTFMTGASLTVDGGRSCL